MLYTQGTQTGGYVVLPYDVKYYGGSSFMAFDSFGEALGAALGENKLIYPQVEPTATAVAPLTAGSQLKVITAGQTTLLYNRNNDTAVEITGNFEQVRVVEELSALKNGKAPYAHQFMPASAYNVGALLLGVTGMGARASKNRLSGNSNAA